MDEQLNLFDDDYELLDYLSSDSPVESVRKFLKQHREHPKVYEMFKKFAFQDLSIGKKYISAYFIGQRVRFLTDAEDGDRFYKLNNTWFPYYVRLFVKDYPEYKNRFLLKKSKADKMLTDGQQVSPG